MNARHESGLRAGNRALDFLVSRYSPMDPKLHALTNSLSKFADGLYRDAEDAARTLLQNATASLVTHVAKGVAPGASGGTQQRILANCIFDLQSTVFFIELKNHLGDCERASALVDALLYQATGDEAASATEDELLDAGTQNVRGISKYQAARKSMPHIADTEAWIFGKEFSAIVSGNPKDFAYVVSVSPFSVLARVRARWHIRFLLHGVVPTEEEKQAFHVALRNQEKSLNDFIDGFGKLQTADVKTTK